MSFKLIESLIELVIGILININIKKITELIFRSKERMYFVVIRFVGIFCIIDSLFGIYHYLQSIGVLQ